MPNRMLRALVALAVLSAGLSAAGKLNVRSGGAGAPCVSGPFRIVFVVDPGADCGGPIDCSGGLSSGVVGGADSAFELADKISRAINQVLAGAGCIAGPAIPNPETGGAHVAVSRDCVDLITNRVACVVPADSDIGWSLIASNGDACSRPIEDKFGNPYSIAMQSTAAGPIPTMSEVGVVVLALLLAVGGALLLRRGPTPAT